MIQSFCEKYGYPLEALRAFSECFLKVTENADVLNELYGLIDLYIDTDDNSYESRLNKIAAAIGVNRYTLYMVFFIMAEREIRRIYSSCGLSEQYIGLARDTFYKCEECFKIHGVWGTSVLFWFRLYAKRELFALGRLQYEPTILEKDYSGFGKKGDKAIGIHIPSGGPLLVEDVYDSLDKAYEFFGGKGEEMLFTSNTWLFYPPQCEMYAEGSNLKKFAELFCITEWEDSNRDFWRVFYKESADNLDDIVPETSLAEKILNRLKEGKTMGFGRGFILYKPEYHGKISRGKTTI